jgi:hypothetical protein
MVPALSVMIVTVTAIGVLVGTGTGVANAATGTLKIHKFANTSAALERDIKTTFQCNSLSGAYVLKMTNIDVTYSDGDSFLGGDLNFDLHVGADKVLIPITQNSTTGLWQVGSSGLYAGTLPPSDCTADTPVIIEHDLDLPPGAAMPAGPIPVYLSSSL